MAVEYTKPLPAPDPDTEPFWDACQAHELRAQRCAACGRYRFPPQGPCPACYSWEAEWAKLPETGTIVSYVVVHYVSVPAFGQDVPYTIAHIAVDGTDGNVELTSNVVGIPWEEVKVGMPVRVEFEDVTPEITLPRFRPA